MHSVAEQLVAVSPGIDRSGKIVADFQIEHTAQVVLPSRKEIAPDLRSTGPFDAARLLQVEVAAGDKILIHANDKCLSLINWTGLNHFKHRA
jgi:hypothetical protein